VVVVLLLLSVLLAWAACQRQRGGHSTLPAPYPPPAIVPYERDGWPHWRDSDRDCQNTRNEVLIAESLEPVVFADGRGCKVLRGLWKCPYTGHVFREPRGLDIDHLVPLKNAHASGGHRWTRKQRTAYANDLSDQDHLVAVAASANRAKSAQSPDLWLPRERRAWCWYARAWRRVKARWGLSMRDAERARVDDLDRHCRGAGREAR
jgi:hypothetical protein